MFLHHLINLEKSSLAYEIFITQKNYNLPGFVNEGRNLLKQFSLPNIIDEAITFTKYQWKRRVRNNIYSDYEKILKRKISEYSS